MLSILSTKCFILTYVMVRIYTKRHIVFKDEFLHVQKFQRNHIQSFLKTNL